MVTEEQLMKLQEHFDKWGSSSAAQLAHKMGITKEVDKRFIMELVASGKLVDKR
jgi:hypothetical protein